MQFDPLLSISVIILIISVFYHFLSLFDASHQEKISKIKKEFNDKLIDDRVKEMIVASEILKKASDNLNSTIPLTYKNLIKTVFIMLLGITLSSPLFLDYEMESIETIKLCIKLLSWGLSIFTIACIVQTVRISRQKSKIDVNANELRTMCLLKSEKPLPIQDVDS